MILVDDEGNSLLLPTLRADMILRHVVREHKSFLYSYASLRDSFIRWQKCVSSTLPTR